MASSLNRASESFSTRCFRPQLSINGTIQEEVFLHFMAKTVQSKMDCWLQTRTVIGSVVRSHCLPKKKNSKAKFQSTVGRLCTNDKACPSTCHWLFHQERPWGHASNVLKMRVWNLGTSSPAINPSPHASSQRGGFVFYRNQQAFNRHNLLNTCYCFPPKRKSEHNPIFLLKSPFKGWGGNPFLNGQPG